MNKDELIKIIGNNLQQLRTRRGLTQEGLAKKWESALRFMLILNEGTEVLA